MSEPVFLGPFMPAEKGEDYLSHMNQAKTLVFENSSHLVEEAMAWLQNARMEEKYGAARGTDLGLKKCLVLLPKSTEQSNRGFSEEYLKGGQLTRKKSKYAPE